ncbi:cadmium transporter [Pilimelia anulata]|uniref:Cadmium transporter n=1 Tax=Pilimelia anulata TaxID=53371 RepID=A0A8J3F7V4_9ACTN|nr:cadmium resistance transporter [Pilimelia anulata]GGJ80438.1 cadmium transporter [Pilimelia anulata]
MDPTLPARAAAMFAVTNLDDLLLLALYLARATGRAGVARVVAGQYLGFLAILAASVLGALGAGLLPPSAVPYSGLLPILLGLRAAVAAWRERRAPAGPADPDPGAGAGAAAGPGVLAVAGVTLANGGDNVGVYVPVFAAAGPAAVAGYAAVFLVGVGVWCAAGHWLATRRAVARTMARWGHAVLPVALIAIGLTILLTA